MSAATGLLEPEEESDALQGGRQSENRLKSNLRSQGNHNLLGADELETRF